MYSNSSASAAFADFHFCAPAPQSLDGWDGDGYIRAADASKEAGEGERRRCEEESGLRRVQ